MLQNQKTFERSPLYQKVLDFPSAKRIDNPGLRLYETPDGKHYPSVTTVLGSLPKPEIDAWKKAVGEEEARAVSQRATRNGTLIHEMCENYLLDEFDEKKYNLLNYMSFNPIKKILDDHVDGIIGVEKSLYSDSLQSAGTIDLIAYFENTVSIIDFKTASDRRAESQIKGYFMQSAAYGHMMNEHFDLGIKQIVIIMTIQGGESQVFVQPIKAHLKDYLKLRIQFKEEHGI